MLRRTLDDSFAEAIRRDITTVTVARLCANALYRYVGPFLAVVADGLDVSVAELGVALTVAQVCGFASPAIGRLVDHLPRRRSIALGLAGCALGGGVAAVSSGIIWFTVGLMTIATFNIVLVVGTGSWIADHVPFAQRSRVVGLNETSWALGLLIGVSAMGLVTAATSWRWAYAVAALAAGVVLVVVLTRLDGTAEHRAEPPEQTNVGAARSVWRRVPSTGWLAVAGVVSLMAASESLFVTFGPWLKDEFSVSDTALAATTFALGAVELAASGLSMTRTDRWGKERSVIGGSVVMIAAALVFLTVDQWAVPGMLLRRRVHRRLRVLHRQPHPDRRRARPRTARPRPRAADGCGDARSGDHDDPDDVPVRPRRDRRQRYPGRRVGHDRGRDDDRALAPCQPHRGAGAPDLTTG